MPLLAIFFVILLAGCDGVQSPDSPAVHRAGQPQVLRLSDRDPVLQAACNEARETLPAFVEHLRNPRPSQSMVAVLARFADGEHAEHLWLTGVRYENGGFAGEVANKPVDLANIRLGERVQVDERDLRDWLIIDDGDLLGGYTIRVLREDLGPAERDRFDRQLGLSPRH